MNWLSRFLQKRLRLTKEELDAYLAQRFNANLEGLTIMFAAVGISVMMLPFALREFWRWARNMYLTAPEQWGTFHAGLLAATNDMMTVASSETHAALNALIEFTHTARFHEFFGDSIVFMPYLIVVYFFRRRIIKILRVPGFLNKARAIGDTEGDVDKTIINGVMVLMTIVGIPFGIEWLIRFVLAFSTVSFAIPIFVISAWAFFVFRVHCRWFYGLVEIVAGIGAISYTITAGPVSDLGRVTGIVGGVYIIVRGLDNVDQNIDGLIKVFPERQGEKIQEHWNRIFKLRRASA